MNLCCFFEAEDGIRYYKVTGVQTCALPSCVARDLREQLDARGDLERRGSTAPMRCRAARTRAHESGEGHLAERDRRADVCIKIGRASCRKESTCGVEAGEEEVRRSVSGEAR